MRCNMSKHLRISVELCGGEIEEAQLVRFGIGLELSDKNVLGPEIHVYVATSVDLFEG